ncbi:hypothetical protein AS156_00395 [Bradyrhizobium macuxiense]|uniref:HTH merR-type domain-containing protein n=1 Tax=Bradyrhizobium macuxiense TaxID=1755647 RepID=A0A109JSC7_9BRAD|nr:hypothetical protein [Bradyrhizobium macuxiense]KWV54235.1 hypothetical protein AS156_00395 [Bradyrhizobium macuxiense]
MTPPRFDLAIAEACKVAQVPYEDFISTVMAGSYPCLPGAAPGSSRRFDETDLLALYIYGRLRAFGFGALRAGEYACRAHAVLTAQPQARSVSIALTPDGGKRVVVEQASLPSAAAMLAEQIQFDIGAIRQSPKQQSVQGSAAAPA